MELAEYKQLVESGKFNEYPYVNGFNQDLLSSFLKYEDLDFEFKVYLTKVILCRSFYGTYTAWYEDVLWFIRGFLQEYQRDIIRPALTEAVREAIQMAIADEKHSKAIIGTSFMYGILEFYAKYHLGFRPLNYNFSDERKHDYSRLYHPKGKRVRLTLAPAFEILQQQNLSISVALNDIDTFTTERLTALGITESKDKGIHYKIVDRLTNTRNPMLHGERHSPQDGPYLSMLYILFYFVDLKYLPQDQLPAIHFNEHSVS